MYQAYLLLREPNDFTMEKARQRLSDAFADASFIEEADSLAMDTPDWELSVRDNRGPEVAGESQRFAEQITGLQDDQGLATCARRIEVMSDVPDPVLEHFEKYQRVLDVMRTFEGGILIDPNEPWRFSRLSGTPFGVPQGVPLRKSILPGVAETRLVVVWRRHYHRSPWRRNVR